MRSHAFLMVSYPCGGLLWVGGEWVFEMLTVNNTFVLPIVTFLEEKREKLLSDN